MSRPVALAVVRTVARVVSFSFAPEVRRMTDPTFVEWADHRWQRERESGVSAPRAAGRALRVLLADALATAPATWTLFAAAAAHGGDRQLAPRRPWWRRLVDGSGGDLRLAVRSVRQRPGFALLVIVTLGLGIGASAAAFDALDRTVLRPMPFADSDRLALVAMHEVKRGYFMTPSAATVARWRQAATTLEGIELARGLSAVRTGDGPAERVAVLGVSGGLPTLLQVQPRLGRMLGVADAQPDAPPAVMIAESVWRRRYGASPDVIGRVVHLSGIATTIAGVWPEGARVLASQEPPVFIRVFKTAEELTAGSYFNIIVKLKPGVTADAVETELAALQAAAADSAAHDVGLRPTVQLPSELLGDAYLTGLWLVFVGAVALLIASIANASHLIAVRASARRFELGVRLAVGGSLGRLLRLFLFEGVVLGAAGIALALGIATMFENLMASFEPRLFAPVLGAGLAGRALLFACATALVAVIAGSIAPLLVARATDLREALSQSGRTTARTSRWRLASIATQAAIAAILVVGAALMARSYGTLARVDPGIDAAHVGSVSASWPASRYPTPEARRAYASRLRQTLTTIPGIAAVTTSGMPILSTSIAGGVPYLEGEPEPADMAGTTQHGSDAVYEDFFRVVGTRLVAGRYFESDERNVAVVTENFARQRSESVVGKMLHWQGGKKPPVQIVGVIADLSVFGVAARQTPVTVLRPTNVAWESPTFVRFLYRTDGDPAALSEVIRQRFAEIDPDVPASAMESGREVLRRQTRQHRFVAVLLAALATLGVMLAMAGMYGAVALDVSRRTREVGIRFALGASRRQVVQTLVRRGLTPVIAGAVSGLLAAQLLTPQLESLLFGVHARDLLSVASAAAVVLFAALVACVLPARRAGRIDPIATLRT